jgi:TRAP-type mannitol/chloroaromatic compound transport system permease small subunit
LCPKNRVRYIPLVATALYRRQRDRGGGPRASLATAYFLWLTAGFVGLHRFYARSSLGFGYLPLFLGVLYGNGRVRDARDALSAARRELQNAEFDIGYWQSRLNAGVDTAAASLADAQARLADLQGGLQTAVAGLDRWEGVVGSLALVIGLWLLIDAALLPRLMRRRGPAGPPVADRDARSEEEAAIRAGEVMVVHAERPVQRQIEFAFTVDALNRKVGELVSWWSVIAVLVYYYEVVGRYVFNSPTNWAHESMFLMFGMQYLLAGGFALLNDSHVRVDIVFARLSPRRKAATDLLTSVFFFIFAGTILWTGFVFARDAVNLWEVSFTEWGIQYWPVKSTIAVGGALLLLQGVAKLIRDIDAVLAPRP